MPQTPSSHRFTSTPQALPRPRAPLGRGPHESAQPPWPGQTGPPLPEQDAEVSRVRIAWTDLALCHLTAYEFIAEEAEVETATLLHVTHGALTVELGHEQHVVEGGAALVCRLRAGDRIVAAGAARVVSVAIPVIELPQQLQTGGFEPQRIGASTLLRASSALVEALVIGGPVPSAHAIPIANAVTDIQVVLLSAEAGLEDDPESPLAVRLLAHIDTHLMDPALTPNTIAAKFNISRRTLYNALAAEHIAVARHIREKRLTAAAHYLEAHPSTRPTALARRFGFARGSQLTRAFQARFGVTVAVYGRQHSGC